jgi:AmmeMemoRadiSam system protein A
LSQQDRNELMGIAKKSVEAAVRERKLYQCSTGSEALMQDRRAFVTLRKTGELRGCIGYIAPLKPLCMTVRDVAASAAVQEPRFPPVSVAELGELEFEISVLSPLRRVTDIKQIKVGQHGLVMKRGRTHRRKQSGTGL